MLLIGYMRILSPSFCHTWHQRCINVHPSLLPDFAGGMDMDVHAEVIAAGRTETGCTIHLVTPEVDGGPIVIQKKCPVLPSDDPDTLKGRVQALEGVAFLEAIDMYRLCSGPWAGGAGMAGVAGKKPLSYEDSGVSIDAGNALVERIKPACKSTRRPGCDADLGGFGGLFDLSAAGYDLGDTILVGATDGVGTKLLVARIAGIHTQVRG